jgi:methyl halide transferase
MTARGGQTWEELWAAGLSTGEYFDTGVCHPALADIIASNTLLHGAHPSASQGRALVPGCGRGYEVVALADSGQFESVVGLDLAPMGVAAARQHADEAGIEDGADFVCGDFFAFDGGEGFRLVVDYTFLCALPPEMRPAWAKKMAELVQVGGVLVTLIFPLLKLPKEGGPPHGVSFEMFEKLLTEVGFEACEPSAVLVRHLGLFFCDIWWCEGVVMVLTVFFGLSAFFVLRMRCAAGQDVPPRPRRWQQRHRPVASRCKVNCSRGREFLCSFGMCKHMLFVMDRCATMLLPST